MRTGRTIRSLPLLSLQRYNKRPYVIRIFVEEQQIENLVNNFYKRKSIVRDFGCMQIYII